MPSVAPHGHCTARRFEPYAPPAARQVPPAARKREPQFAANPNSSGEVLPCPLVSHKQRTFLDAWVQAKRAGDFAMADTLAKSLTAEGVPPHIFRADPRAPPPPTALNSHISQSHNSAEALVALIDGHCERFDLMHLSNIWNKLGKVGCDHFDLPRRPELKRLLEHTAAVVLRPSERRPREIANIVHGIVRAGMVRQSSRLLNALAMQLVTAPAELHAYTPRDTASLLWGFAHHSGVECDQLFEAMALEWTERLHEFVENAADAGHSISVVAWACAQTDAHMIPSCANDARVRRMRATTRLFEGYASEVVAHLRAFTPLQLANTVHSFARLGLASTVLFRAVASAIAPRRLSEFQPGQLSRLLWAYAISNEASAALFEAVADHLVSIKLRGFDDMEDLSTIAWAYAVADVRASHFFTALATRILRVVHDSSEYPRLAARLGDDHLRQVLQWQLWIKLGGMAGECYSAELERICRHTTLGRPDDLERRDAAVWQDVPMSKLQRRVAVAARVVYPHHPLNVEYVEPLTGYSLDFALPASRVGIEVDGPKHFNHPWGPIPTANGATELKRRLLRLAGWRVISVAYNEWPSTEEAAAQRLRPCERGEWADIEARQEAEQDLVRRKLSAILCETEEVPRPPRPPRPSSSPRPPPSRCQDPNGTPPPNWKSTVRDWFRLHREQEASAGGCAKVRESHLNTHRTSGSDRSRPSDEFESERLRTLPLVCPW